MRRYILVLACVAMVTGTQCLAAEQVLPIRQDQGWPFDKAQGWPDELTLNVGEVKGVGTNVTLVLTKRSMRSENYVCGILSDDGFKRVTFPVSTYRGYVEGDSGLRVLANIEPGGLLTAFISAGQGHIGKVEAMKIDIPKGKCTPVMGTGNKVVPLKSLPVRTSPTPSGCLVPKVPMRQSKWLITAPQSYTDHADYETVVSRIEARWNDGDHVFARDAGTAWEIDVMVLMDPRCTTTVDMSKVLPGEPDRTKLHMHGIVTGADGRNNGKGSSLCVAGDMRNAFILLHEGAHCYGNWCHQMDEGDGLFGGGSFFGRNNVQILASVQDSTNMYCHRDEDDGYVGCVYNGVLPPYAMRDIVATRKDTKASFAVLENDYDGNGDAIFLQAVTPASKKGGQVAVSADRQKAEYTPPPGFVGLDEFTYTVADSTGAANKCGFVKVDVRPEGLAYSCDFENPVKDGVEWLIKANDWRMWAYNDFLKTPESERITYRFPATGAYAESTADALWIPYVPVKGVKGNALYNPVGNVGAAQVDLCEGGDPGREDLSASIWVLFPQKAGGVILCKSSYGFKTVMGGWAIRATDKGFSFFGNTVRLLGNQPFELHSEEPIEPMKWYHLVMVMDRKAKKLRAYVNGKALTATSSSDTIADETIEYHDKLRLFNGSGWKSWGARPMLVDELKIFAEALTPKQVAALYAEGKDANVPKLPEGVKKSEGAGKPAKDEE